MRPLGVDASTGREILGPCVRRPAVAFMPDGKRAVSSSVDRTVRLWDIETGREPA
jgi:WD40 repeat protein